ncbi:vWA domain-containing protein [Pseudonocardia abyssalis]|uniref:VWA domain-containing protein n=1 Tax=Pseudonocardia abyssalis TaxID=2792008 RepID=A0ABS6UZS1_9PSEU|nr:VWA domain-containing protein [Pseudonocardia abyssalis]MBW0117934.1 VWA domain-containing protein [Pseudonocardia abyssalis]MBW0137746.1 VWA domain-containing protein [Pseudonocardia abyssalis]
MTSTETPVGDPIEGLVGFTVVLRSAGLAVTTDRVAAFLSALDALDVTSRTQTYWAGRLTLCSDPDDLPRYDRAFEDWFTPPRGGGRTRIVDERKPPPPKLAALTPSTQGESDDEGTESTQVFTRASGNEVLRNRDLAELTPSEREHLRRLLALLRPELPTRRSRRLRPSRHGATDPGRTLRAALRDHGEMRHLRRRDQSRRPRRVVLLVDVSGSMEPYADALLRFAHVVVRRSPGTVEAFTLGTRLTRITRELRMRDADRALAAAGRAIPDWSGGTRLGEVMRAFVDRWGQRGAARRAVVVVFSDGWERGETELLGVQMSRLHRLAHKLVWVNPHAGKDGYAPVQGGIVAALPYLDDLLAGHSLATLEELLEVVRNA